MADIPVAEKRSKAGFDLTPPSPALYRALVDGLDAEEQRVILEHGTERPFCGIFNEAKTKGTYGCRLCGLPLFRSGAKFESGTGWPSFFDPIDRAHVELRAGHELWHGPQRDPLCAVRGASRARLR